MKSQILSCKKHICQGIPLVGFNDLGGSLKSNQLKTRAILSPLKYGNAIFIRIHNDLKKDALA
jgi:hypothetical protein